MAIATTAQKIKTGRKKRYPFPGNLKALNLEISLGKQISSQEILFFTNQLALMLEIGTPLNVSLSSISRQIKNPKLKNVVADILGEVEEGKMLSTALARHSRTFSPEYISLVSAGEKTGQLWQMLNRVVELQEKREEFVSALKGAMTYPLVLCAVTTGVIIFMLTFVFPRFTTLFEGVEDILPPTTKFLMSLSDLFRTHWYLLVALFGATWMGIHHYIRTDPGRLAVDRLKISLPLISGMMIKVYLSQTMRTLGFLMGSSVPLVEALEIIRGGMKNLLFSRFVDRIREHVEGGRGFALAFQETPFIPETVTQMVSTGEASQKLDHVLLRLSDHYEGEIRADVKRMTTIIEPVLLIVMGIVVGLIVVSLILPIFKLSKVVH